MGKCKYTNVKSLDEFKVMCNYIIKRIEDFECSDGYGNTLKIKYHFEVYEKTKDDYSTYYRDCYENYDHSKLTKKFLKNNVVYYSFTLYYKIDGLVYDSSQYIMWLALDVNAKILFLSNHNNKEFHIKKLDKLLDRLININQACKIYGKRFYGKCKKPNTKKEVIDILENMKAEQLLMDLIE